MELTSTQKEEIERLLISKTTKVCLSMAARFNTYNEDVLIQLALYMSGIFGEFSRELLTIVKEVEN